MSDHRVKTAPFGSTGISISRLGVGGWQAGGTGPWGAGPQSDDDDAIAAIRRAVERGVTWVETAASYGLGHSEEVVARALQPWHVGDEVLVFSKCGHPWEPPDRIWTELTPESIRRQCEESLRRLGVDRIDLYQFHHPDPATPVEESWATLAELVEEGKVRWAGVSNFDVDLLERCEAIRHVDASSPELSLLRPGATKDVIPWCRDQGTGVIVYSPQTGGLLSGARDASSFAAMTDETRQDIPGHAIEALVEALQRIGRRRGIGPGAIAIDWTLAVDGVTAAICGARTPTQVDGWIVADEVALSEDDIREIEEALADAGIEA